MDDRMLKMVLAVIMMMAGTFLPSTGIHVWAQETPVSRDSPALVGKHHGGKKDKGGGGQNKRQERHFPPPAHVWNISTIILGCPTDRQIVMSLTTSETLDGYVEYGKVGNEYSGRTTVRTYTNGVPAHVTLDGLSRDTGYQYRLCYRTAPSVEFSKGPAYSFHTQRAAGHAFTFEVQGDSHPERTPRQNDPVLYEQTLLAAAHDQPDFYFCMGDDFSVDTLASVTSDAVARVYFKQLPYLGLVAHSSPLFLVNGNHEQAARCNYNGAADNVAVWAQTCRDRFFPQPGPDTFYSGDGETVPHIGLLHDYYAWTWGDALFVVLDPYWHSNIPVDNSMGGDKKRRDLWEITLGKEQYKWFARTLESSCARFKFVFAHHVNGTGRGGVEQADSYEWGGRSPGGEWGFAGRRPGWELPIHQLMAKHGVTIFFQGHDHVFAHQEKDGVIYQTVPEPADPHYTLCNPEAYRSGDVLPNSGRLRVTVADKVMVEYVRSYLPGDATAAHPEGEVAFSYSANGRRKP